MKMTNANVKKVGPRHNNKEIQLMYLCTAKTSRETSPAKA